LSLRAQRGNLVAVHYCYALACVLATSLLRRAPHALPIAPRNNIVFIVGITFVNSFHLSR
jgi:hypothetical protein